MLDPSTPVQPGIAQLQARRQQSGRTVPPPKHSPRASVAALERPSTEPEVSLRGTSPPEAFKAPPAVPSPAVVAKSEPSPARASEVATEALVRATIHFGAGQDRFLNTVAHAGRMNTPKVDASRSAVTRLAIERLEQQMPTEQIVAELASRASATTRPGRKRL